MSIQILVATQETQGQRKNDFCWVPEGEPVHFPATQCDGETADGRCGCKRSLVGVACAKSTTTVKVILYDDDLFSLDALIQGAYRRNGYTEIMGEDEVSRFAQKEAEELTRIASYCTIGTVLEYRDDAFTVRTGSMSIPREKGAPQ